METSDALLLRNMDIQAGNGEPVNGSWMIRDADREGTDCRKIGTVCLRCLFVIQPAETFRQLAASVGQEHRCPSGEWEETFIIAGFTEDVLFGSRSNIAFDLPQASLSSVFRIWNQITMKQAAIPIKEAAFMTAT